MSIHLDNSARYYFDYGEILLVSVTISLLVYIIAVDPTQFADCLMQEAVELWGYCSCPGH
jgi:hypothetical protein